MSRWDWENPVSAAFCLGNALWGKGRIDWDIMIIAKCPADAYNKHIQEKKARVVRLPKQLSARASFRAFRH